MNEHATQLLEQLKTLLSNCQFVGLTYTSKKSGETARWTLRVNSSYIKFLEKNILEAEIRLQTLDQQSVEALALVEMKLSWEKSLFFHKQQLENPDYTKAGMYEHLGNGVKVLKNDNTLEVQGVVHSYKVIVPGEHKKVTHRTPITAKKAELKDQFESWVTLSIDLDNLHGARVNGEEVEII